MTTRRSARGAKRTTYTDEYRAKAVAAAIANGYPSVKGALSRTAASLGIAHQLLRGWIVAEHNAPPQQVLQAKKLDLRELFMNEIYDAAGKWQAKRDNASYSQLVIAVATLYDKVRLIDNLPTEIIGVTTEFLVSAQKHGYDPMAIMRNLINEMDSAEAVEVEA